MSWIGYPGLKVSKLNGTTQNGLQDCIDSSPSLRDGADVRIQCKINRLLMIGQHKILDESRNSP